MSSTSLATTRLPTRWTPIKGQQSWIRATRTLKLAFSFFALAVLMVDRHLLLLSLPICIPQRTRQVLRAPLNGQDLHNSNPLDPLLLLRPLASAGLAACLTSTRRPSRPTLTKTGAASLSVVVAQRRLSGSLALLRKSRRRVNHTPSLTDLARRVVARRRRRRLINMPSLFLRHHLSPNLRLPRRLSGELPILTGVARRLRYRHLLPITRIAPTHLLME